MLNYPLNFTFKIVVFNPQISVSDSAGNEIFYVKQKALAFKESIKVFSDKSQNNILFNINAIKSSISQRNTILRYLRATPSGL